MCILFDPAIPLTGTYPGVIIIHQDTRPYVTHGSKYLKTT